MPRVEAIIGKNVIERWNFMKQNTKLTKLIIARILNWISIRVEIFPFESISVRSHDTSFAILASAFGRENSYSQQVLALT